MKDEIARLSVIVLCALAAPLASAATEWSTQEYDLYPGDFDGDGRTDLLYVAKDAAKVSGIALSDGSGPNVPFQSWPSNYLGIPWHGNTYKVIVEDFNDDNKADLLLQRGTPGDHFLLLADAHGKITGIAQTIADYTLGQYWSAAEHKIHAGDFSGDGKADLFLQAVTPTQSNVVFYANANGLFTSAATQSWTDASWSSFKWSARNSNVFIGDFNGDGRKDLLLQAKPNITMIDYEITIPVPTYPPNSNGVVLSQGGATPFQQVGVQQWNRNAHGVDWSPNAANIVIGDFDGNGRDDVLLQARNVGRPSYLLSGNASGAAFTSGTALATNVTWSSDSYRLLAGNFDGGSTVGVYFQAQSSGGTNYYANVVTGGSVSQTTHNPGAATGVVPATAVGHTVGSFAVTDGGAATYSIPIVVPPGVAGVQPALSINYTSGSGNGPLGIGWGLGGLSEIERCGKTFVQDNAAESVTLTTGDRFCLDGNKLRLTSGTYGAASSTYQTEIETFSKVTAQGVAGNGPAYFTVEAKDGLTYEYGGTADSRIESLNPSALTTPHTWALNKVTDRHGNSMSITYQEDAAPNGGYRPTMITYTANTDAALAAASRVVLVWETRPDAVSGYVAGGAVKDLYRLNRIETQYNDSGWALVRRYQLSYNTSGISGRSRLSAIQECDRNANCLSPTTVGWQEGTFGWPSTPINTVTLPASGPGGMPLDIDGDGRTDYVYFDTGTNYWKVAFANSDGTYQTPVNAFSLTSGSDPRGMPMDVNGDGKQDLLLANVADGKWWWVRHSSGTTFTSVATNLFYNSPGPRGTFTADLNGDGLDDVISASVDKLYVSLNQSTATVPSFTTPTAAWTTPYATSFPSLPFGSNGERFSSGFETVDFDGDGKDEIVVNTEEDECAGEPGCPPSFMYEWRVMKWVSPALVQTSTVYSGNAAVSRPLLADIDSDGLSDVVYKVRVAPNTWRWRYRVGSGAVVDTGVVAHGEGLMADCDSDGRADLVSFDGTSSYQCMRSTGAGLSTTPVAISTSLGAKVADVNGDGQLDFIEFDGGTVLKVRLHRGVVPDLASSLTDGFGNTVTVKYAPLTDSNVYTAGSGALFPVIDIGGAMYVVKQYTATDGIGGSYSVTESYTGARAHVRGRGFLGFATRTTIDGRTGVKSVSEFIQDYPHVGMPREVSVYQPSSTTLISRTTNTPATLDLSTVAYNERKFPYVQQSVQKTYEAGGPGNGAQISQVTKTTTLDSYANPTNVATVTVDSVSGASYNSTTVNTYPTSDAVCWERGFVTQQQVTSTVPNQAAKTRTVEYVKDTTKPAACRVREEIIEPTGGNDVKVTTTIGYDVFGNPSSKVVTAANIEARTTTTSFLPQGVFPVSVTESVATGVDQTAYKTYDFALGVAKTMTDPNGLVVSFDYDGFGRLLKQTRPDSTKTTYGYSACTVGNGYCGDSRLRYQVEKRELDAGNAVMRTARQLFDSFSRVLYSQSQTLSGAFSNVATNYDNQGRAYQQSQPYFAGFPVYYTTTYFDLLDRPSSEQRRISEADSGTQTTSYTYNRLVHSQTDANGKTTTKEFDAIGQVVKMTDAANGITTYEHDPFGNLTGTTDPAGNKISSSFNIRGFKTAMNDRDLGAWGYTYYPTGELWTQTDAKGQTATFTYDRISRLSTRAEPEGTTTFTYGTSATAKNIGRMVSVTAPGGYSESFTYDSLSRLQDATTNADSTSFVISSSYNATTGLLEAVTYPTSTTAVPGSRFKVKYEYEYGLPKRTRDFHTPSTIYWEQIAGNAAGQTVDELFGNGLHTYSTYDGLTGLLGARTAGPSSQVQYSSYQWDKTGNLLQRKDHNQSLPQGLTEEFYYDDLYRLRCSTLNVARQANCTVLSAGQKNLEVTYDATGNIASKTGVGSYAYPTPGASSVRPHAVTAVGSMSFGYDANGNMNNRNGDAITWYSYNLPSRIDKGSSYSQFYYGADRGRYKQVAVTAAGGSLPAGTETTIYVGGVYERVTKPSGVIEHKHYVVGNKEPVAVRTLRSSSSNDTQYLHKDHLGSVDAITSESGTVLLQLSHDAFGKRRNAVGWAGAPAAGDWTSIAALTHRGFTFHEALDNVDLVHMNGRVYDPNLGRFISADPIIQAPLMSQSLNRYSYVMNNPLSLTDPSGYSWLSKKLRKIRRHLHAKLRLLVNGSPKNLFEMIKTGPFQDKIDRYVMSHKWAYGVGQFAATVATSWSGGWGGALWASYYTYRGTGSVTEALKVGAITFATSYAMQAVGAYYGNTWNIERVLVEGAIGGISSELSGGSFADGFRVGAGFSLLSWAAYEMREDMIRQSCTARSPNCAKDASMGAYGDKQKMGGGRMPDGLSDWADVDRSPLGGNQGGVGKFLWVDEYAKGSFFDFIVESYSGSHDWLSSFRYTSNGGYLIPYGRLATYAYEGYSALAVLVATPFAIATRAPAYAAVPSIIGAR